MVWLSGGNMTILWLFPRGQFCVWTFKNDRMEWGSLFSDKAKSVTFTCWNSSAKVKLGSGREGGISVAGIGTLGHWRLLICEFMTFHDLCCCSMSFLYVGSIPHSNRICSEFGSNAISSTQRCLTTPGTVKMLGAALAPWQNALLVSCWTITSIGGVYGVLWRPETKGIVRVTLCVGIIALAFRFAQVLQFLGYLVAMAGDYNDYGIENNQTKGQSCNDGASRTMTTSRIKLICPKLQPHCHPCPIYFIQFQQHQITKWSIVLQNITQSCLEIFVIFW